MNKKFRISFERSYMTGESTFVGTLGESPTKMVDGAGGSKARGWGFAGRGLFLAEFVFPMFAKNYS